MIDTLALVQSLRDRGVALFAGVPDSLLAAFSTALLQQLDGRSHVITAHEGQAVAMAMGHYLATGSPGLVYMQNSGLGNAVNPLASLADPAVYGVPMLLLVGWRGQPGHKDEPQHVKQGEITEGQLALLGIPHWVVGPDSPAEALLDQAWAVMTERCGPVALLVQAGALGPVSEPAPGDDMGSLAGAPARLLREAAIGHILDASQPADLVIATTGKTGRELHELRQARGELQCDFLTVGGMGHASSIALGVALAQPQRRVICLDGDGAMLMQLGAAAIIGDLKPANLLHVLLNNRAHDSVGGQPTVGGRIDFGGIARACGYASYQAARDAAGIAAALGRSRATLGPHLLEVHLAPGARADLGRPRSTPQANKLAVMQHLGQGKGQRQAVAHAEATGGKLVTLHT